MDKMNASERLSKIMESQEMNAKQFAQKLGVSAGTLSNIFGGRNNPSYELIQNTLKHFPQISAEWLVMGEGEMYKDGITTSVVGERDLFSDMNAVPQHVQPTMASESNNVSANIPTKSSPISRQIKKIVIFYTDGTFEER